MSEIDANDAMAAQFADSAPADNVATVSINKPAPLIRPTILPTR